MEYLVNEVKGNPLGARGLQNALAKSMNGLLFDSLTSIEKDIIVKRELWQV